MFSWIETKRSFSGSQKEHLMTVEKSQSTFQCPACHKTVWYATRVKFYVFQEPDERQLDATQNDYQNSPAFACPYCNTSLQARYHVTVIEVLRLDTPVEPIISTSWNSIRFTEAEVNLLELCRANGLIDIFTRVVREQVFNEGQTPKVMDRYFISFLRTAQRKDLPKPILDEFIREFPGRIEFWKAHRIGMVISDGRICRFVPMRSMNLDVTKRSEALKIHGVSVNRDKENFEYLKRTTIGYVPPTARIFLESLRHATGDRGRTMQDIPLRPKK